ncbi:MAG TPA: DUF4229 domain-containing protein [Nocardioides sp.]|nr:DUF4229 domain-containing protein [Nocardioides sp.]
MKEFWVYTALRVGLFLATLIVVFGVWFAITHDVPLTWAVVLSFLISAPASFVILNRPREQFAQRVTGRADRIVNRYEAARSKEDVD